MHPQKKAEKKKCTFKCELPHIARLKVPVNRGIGPCAKAWEDRAMQSNTSQAFGASLPFILRWEGGFVDDPDDRGGRTNKGVTQNVYHAWRADQCLPQPDVQQINDQEVAAIYYQRYCSPTKCDALRPKLDLAALRTPV